MKIEIYEKALCCETGVCGTDVDTELLESEAQQDTFDKDTSR